jgi:hypothetical protein
MSELETDVIEIRDPELDEHEIRKRIKTQVAQRQAAGSYGPDPATQGPESLRRTYEGTPATESMLTEFPGLNQLLIELMAREPLHEVEFTSSAPLVAPLIVAVRRAWNWMSTKWYVLPVIRQQAFFNNQLVTLLNEMVQRQEISARQLAQLQAQVESLQKQLAERDR